MLKTSGTLKTEHGYTQETCLVCLESSHRYWFRRFGNDKEHCACEGHKASEFLEAAERLVQQGLHDVAAEFRHFAHWLDKEANKIDAPVRLCIRQISQEKEKVIQHVPSKTN